MSAMSPLRYVYLLLAVALIVQAGVLAVYVLPQDGISAFFPWLLAVGCLIVGMRS
jgi:hypothetical protein